MPALPTLIYAITDADKLVNTSDLLPTPITLDALAVPGATVIPRVYLGSKDA
jgi:hypothetical protein